MKRPKVIRSPELARLNAAIAALNAAAARPLLEELRDAQLDALEADFGSRVAATGGLLCVDGFCVEPFLDAATALEIPDYDITEIVEICLRTGPWARVDVSVRWNAGRPRCACGRLPAHR